VRYAETAKVDHRSRGPIQIERSNSTAPTYTFGRIRKCAQIWAQSPVFSHFFRILRSKS
jgi:hypothetical protein